MRVHAASRAVPEQHGKGRRSSGLVPGLHERIRTQPQIGGAIVTDTDERPVRMTIDGTTWDIYITSGRWVRVTPAPITEDV